jgi:chromosome partitioning protein
MSIIRAVAVAQGKGGVGKTSLATNIAGLAAAGGFRACIVDLDQQGNVARDLGFPPNSGDELFASLISTAPLPRMTDVRPGLDVVPGGPATGDLASVFASRIQRGTGDDLATVLESKLGAIAGDYDLIMVDTPPGDRVIVEAALTISSAVIIPTRMDEASIDGVTRIAERFVAVRGRNPNLRLAGVVLFAIAQRTTRLERDVREALTSILEGHAPVFNTRIRYLESAAADARRRGLLVHELEQAGVADKRERLAALRAATAIVEADERKAFIAANRDQSLYASKSSGLAEDYEALTRELLVRLSEIESEVGVSA